MSGAALVTIAGCQYREIQNLQDEVERLRARDDQRQARDAQMLAENRAGRQRVKVAEDALRELVKKYAVVVAILNQRAIKEL